ncbi:hypothetical protein FN846DRAFT_932857 [Sphaerosporella brunnea]|uniref:Uncharacterized protein n=1 Tax=Sphaerosporella brunnea TaxID=1250544 RepID=A0A5J5F6V8_9PEZI|nr:hypothetical protein FN846DRAFT_932857 [Sphaerosporella brunnea]
MSAAQRLPSTEAEFHARHPRPATLATSKALGLSGSEFNARHLILYRVLEQRHPHASSASQAINLNPRLDEALRMFRRNRSLVTASAAEFVGAGGFHVFYSLLAKVLKAGERRSAPAQGVIQRRVAAAAAANPGLTRLRPGYVSGSGMGLSSPSLRVATSSPYSVSSDVSTASVHMDRVGPEALTQHLVSAFLTVVLDMRDRAPPRRLVFWPTAHRMKVVTRKETFVCDDDGGFALDGGDDDRRYASLECKRQWAVAEAEDGSVRLEEPLNVSAQHVAEFLGMAADNQPRDGEAWEDVRRRFFLVVGNQYHLQLKRVDFTPEYLRYVLADPIAHQPVPSSPPVPTRGYDRSSPIEGSMGSWTPSRTTAGGPSVNTTPCPQHFMTHMDDASLSDRGEQESEEREHESHEHKVHDNDDDDDEPELPSVNTHRINDAHHDLPFMTIHTGPIHNLATPQGRVAAAKEILALAEEIESWI